MSGFSDMTKQSTSFCLHNLKKKKHSYTMACQWLKVEQKNLFSPGFSEKFKIKLKQGKACL